MNKLSAQQIVGKLLEYGINPEASAPAGSPQDPWRQHTGPLQPFKFRPRPGAALAPEEEETLPDEETTPAVGAPASPGAPGAQDPLSPPFSKPPVNKYMDRFKWRPPTVPPPAAPGAPVA